MFRAPFIISLSLLISSMIVIFTVSQRGVPKVVRTNIEQMPMNILGRTAVEDFFSKEVYEELNADKHIYRHYFGPEDESIDLYIGYYGTAKGGRTPHNPYACLPSQGWAIMETGTLIMRASYTPEKISLNYIISKNQNITRYMIHWYQSSKSKVLDSGFKRNIHRFVSKIVHNKNDGAYVQVSTTIGNTTEKKVPQFLKEFANEIVKLLPEYWPEEI